MKAAVVIPVGPDRLDNLIHCLTSIGAMDPAPALVVMVGDGAQATRVAEIALDRCRGIEPELRVIEAPKHEPGLDQPRNRGVRVVQALDRSRAADDYEPHTHVWFLDSDVILDPYAYDAFQAAEEDLVERILIGPYDWMPPGVTQPMPQLKNDPRWPSFESRGPSEVLVKDLSAGLACFSGNLAWPIGEFARIGGFWNELHHGRCEDGELGLRAVACGVPISYVAGARGWHIDHPRSVELIEQRNSRDVPMLNHRHPWVQGEGLFVVEEDGRRFNVRCHCGWEGNTAEIWAHEATHEEE